MAVYEGIPDIGECIFELPRPKIKSGRPRGSNWIDHYQNTRPVAPDGLEFDHLCGNVRCINSYHLDAVTHAENIRRSYSGLLDVCPKGHPYSIRIRHDRKGEKERYCKECNRIRTGKNYHGR